MPEWRPLLNPVNNLVYAATGASVRTVLIDGRVVLEDGQLTTLDERAVSSGPRSWRGSRSRGPACRCTRGGL